MRIFGRNLVINALKLVLIYALKLVFSCSKKKEKRKQKRNLAIETREATR
jgi:lysophospholipid acyltransferase (LPLAT)-like uncharacterized protein